MGEQGLLQVDLAERSGVHAVTVSKILTKGKASAGLIGKIAKGLGVEAKNIAVFPRNVSKTRYIKHQENKKTAEAVTPAVDAEQVCIENNNNVITTEAECQKEDRLYFYDGEWRTEKRIYELVTIDKLVELLNLPVIAITRVR